MNEENNNNTYSNSAWGTSPSEMQAGFANEAKRSKKVLSDESGKEAEKYGEENKEHAKNASNVAEGQAKTGEVLADTVAVGTGVGALAKGAEELALKKGLEKAGESFVAKEGKKATKKAGEGILSKATKRAGEVSLLDKGKDILLGSGNGSSSSDSGPVIPHAGMNQTTTSTGASSTEGNATNPGYATTEQANEGAGASMGNSYQETLKNARDSAGANARGIFGE